MNKAALRRERKRIAELKVDVDAEEAAEDAGLRYVSDEQPGYTRKRKEHSFAYFDTEDKPIRDEKRLQRIRKIGIPPAYKKVWICPSANGHLQATGRDARGRKQYRYHERWRAIRDETKYDRMVVFGETLPKIRKRVRADLSLPDLPREKVLATVVSLLERTLMRIGNEEYEKTNKSFGLTTLKNRHVETDGATTTFRFRGKSGVYHEIDVKGRRLANTIRKLHDLPGQELFQYVGKDDERHDIKSQDVNDYLREITGEEFTAKDFRTWAGTVLAALALHVQEPGKTKRAINANVKDAISAVSKVLGNTPAICRKCYVHPAVLETYLDGNLIAGLKARTTEVLEEILADLRREELAVLRFLRERLSEKPWQKEKTAPLDSAVSSGS